MGPEKNQDKCDRTGRQLVFSCLPRGNDRWCAMGAAVLRTIKVTLTNVCHVFTRNNAMYGRGSKLAVMFEYSSGVTAADRCIISLLEKYIDISGKLTKQDHIHKST